MSLTEVGIIDLEIGNLRSVWNAVYQNGFDPAFVRDPAQVSDFGRLILPGVGSFLAAVKQLDSLGFREPILRYAKSGRPLLGICLGMQLLAENGEEGGEVSDGLGLIKGSVSRLRGGESFPIPHMGWNNVEMNFPHPVTAGVKGGADFYFVHSFGLQCSDKQQEIATTEYGSAFASIVGDQNVVGFQFHPEKSQNNGLKLVENFCDWNP